MFDNLLTGILNTISPTTQMIRSGLSAGANALSGLVQPRQSKLAEPLIPGYRGYQLPYSPLNPQSNPFLNDIPVQSNPEIDYDALLGGGGYGGGGGDYGSVPSPQPTYDPLKAATDYISNIYQKFQMRAEEFDRANPFAFDEALAKKSSEERFDPYYQAELGDYLTGVERKRSRTRQDEDQLRRELEVDTETAIGREKRDLQEIIRSSEEGFAGSGIFMSGERLRTTGRQEVSSEERVGDTRQRTQRQTEQSQLREGRVMEDLLSSERTTRRNINAARETDIQTDVEAQRQDALKRREFARNAYVGIPGGGGLVS